MGPPDRQYRLRHVPHATEECDLHASKGHAIDKYCRAIFAHKNPRIPNSSLDSNWRPFAMVSVKDSVPVSNPS